MIIIFQLHGSNSTDLKLHPKSGPRSSKVWDTFRVVWFKGFETKFAICSKCNKVYDVKNGTNALLKHTDKCVVDKDQQTKLMAIPVADLERVKMMCLGVVSHELRPFELFSGPAVKTLMQELIKIGAKYGYHQLKDVSGSNISIIANLKLPE